MPRFVVYGLATASWVIGTYEADTKENAEAMAYNDDAGNTASLCHHCADIEIGDMYDLQSDKLGE